MEFAARASRCGSESKLPIAAGVAAVVAPADALAPPDADRRGSAAAVPASVRTGCTAAPDAAPRASGRATPRPPAKVITVTGRVIDSLGHPIRGAKVGVEGSDDQVATPISGGRFTIEGAASARRSSSSRTASRSALAIVTGPDDRRHRAARARHRRRDDRGPGRGAGRRAGRRACSIAPSSSACPAPAAMSCSALTGDARRRQSCSCRSATPAS